MMAMVSAKAVKPGGLRAAAASRAQEKPTRSRGEEVTNAPSSDGSPYIAENAKGTPDGGRYIEKPNPAGSHSNPYNEKTNQPGRTPSRSGDNEPSNPKASARPNDKPSNVKQPTERSPNTTPKEPVGDQPEPAPPKTHQQDDPWAKARASAKARWK